MASLFRLFAISALALGLLVTVPAIGQSRTFPDQTRVGILKMGVFPVATIDGTAVRFSPGARIKNINNRSVLPVSITAPVVVAFTLDMNGQINAVWAVSRQEVLRLQAR